MEDTRIDSVPAPPGPPGPQDDLRTLGEYRLLRRLGEGGMGEVYLGYSERLGTQVAVKVLAETLSHNQGYVDRFYREAKSGALLNHPNIVRTLNVGRDQATGKHYLILEYVEGLSAHALLDDQGKLDVGDAVHITLDVARALEHAHSRNIVHRDIKPDNILLARSGMAKLVDFGLAKRTDETSHLTATRQGFGTTPYMPYEQAVSAKSADSRSDIYALGATLYHLLTGVVPFPADSHLEVIEKKNQGAFDPAGFLNPAVPPELDRILGRMLAREPRERYQTASELIVDLERSGLVPPIPTFADPEKAREDPWMQAHRATSAEPTRPDPESQRPLTPPSIDLDEDRWLLRVRKRSGQWRKYRATTRQIIQGLREGRMPRHVEASKPPADEFFPLSHFAEFQEITPAPKSGRRLRKPEPAQPATPPGSLSPWTLYLSVAGAVAGALAAGGLLVYFLLQ